jgi:hypothetical protein
METITKITPRTKIRVTAFVGGMIAFVAVVLWMLWEAQARGITSL